MIRITCKRKIAQRTPRPISGRGRLPRTRSVWEGRLPPTHSIWEGEAPADPQRKQKQGQTFQFIQANLLDEWTSKISGEIHYRAASTNLA